jgi:membrane protein
VRQQGNETDRFDAMPVRWDLGGLTWRELGGRVWRELSEDRILGRSAQLSFYFLLSLFPMLLLMMALLGSYVEGQSALRAALAGFLDAMGPHAASKLVSDFLQRLTEGLGAGGVSSGLLVALWAASSGMVALMNALNEAYEVEERRSWWIRRLVALGLTIALLSLIIATLLLVIYGRQGAQAIAAALRVRGAFAAAWQLLEWPLAVAFVLLVFNLLYLYAPNLRHRKWHWLMPGTVVAVALWLLASYGFSVYLSRFGSYNAVYGSLGAVVVLLMWLYLTGVAILIGAQVNSEIERGPRITRGSGSNSRSGLRRGRGAR